MEGFIKNVTPEWLYAMKRSVKPGGEIPLKELFEQYGVKYSIEPGEKFVDWLKTVKLRNSDKWRVVFDFKEDKASQKVEVVDQPEAIKNAAKISSIPARQLQVEDLVNLTVRKAREVLPKVMDLNLVKYALTEANQLANKDSLCRLLVKRVNELTLSR